MSASHRRTALRSVLLFSLLAVAGAVVSGCAGDRTLPPLAAEPVDMAGFWEVDYARSDNLQARYTALLRQLREDSARRAAAAERGQPVTASGSSREAILGLAQMAELVTAAQLLEVEQDRLSIRVQREGNFSLSCAYGGSGGDSNEYGVGRERCYWDGEQLVFRIDLPDGLRITHRLSLAGDRDSLGILTTLYSSSVSAPFSVRRIYRRYTPGSRGYSCTETLTRGRVCTTESR